MIEQHQATRVFVTQEQPGLNYSQAEQYGEIVFVSDTDIPTVKNSLRSEAMLSGMARKLAPYRPGIDYILPSGSPLNIAASFLLVGGQPVTHLILKWENRQRQYFLSTLSLCNILNAGNA